MIEPCLKLYAVPSPSQYMVLRSRSQTFSILCLFFTVSVSAKPLIDLNHVWYEQIWDSKMLHKGKVQLQASFAVRGQVLFYLIVTAGESCIGLTCEIGERGGSVVECRTREREVRGSRPTAAVLCPWARHFTPRKYWLITQEAMAPSRYDWKIVDWDVKPQHNQPTCEISIFKDANS